MAEPKKISELQQIQNISDDDLLIVSDYDNGKCISKKMTLAQLVQYVIQALGMSETMNQTIQQIVNEKTMDIIEENIEDVYDMLDGKKDNKMVIDAN